MGHGYFLIAGKTEGFDYSESKGLRCRSDFDVESMINSLRDEGYTIFYVMMIIERIDDNLTKEAGANG